ncbi:hypothetical protein RB195_008909 [Necator americanus]|uniref:Uncharacterized protein n=2 Tax=Necator americanus TaxID=51031 RepID=A0ABR1CU98_NECAM
MKSTFFFFVVFVAVVAIAKPNPRIHSDSSSEEGPKHKPHHNHHGHHHRRSSPHPPTTVVSPTAPEKSDETTPFADLTTTDEIVVTDVSTDVITSEQVTASDDSSVATLEPMDKRAFTIQSRQDSHASGDKHHRRHHRHHHRHSSPQPRTTAASSSSTEAPEGTTQVADDTSPVTEIVVTGAVTEEVTAEQTVAPSGISDETQSKYFLLTTNIMDIIIVAVLHQLRSPTKAPLLPLKETTRHDVTVAPTEAVMTSATSNNVTAEEHTTTSEYATSEAITVLEQLL